MKTSNEDISSRFPYPNPGLPRVIPIALAVGLATLILIYPRAVATSVSHVNHSLLNLLMWGIAIGFIHGVGFVPHRTVGALCSVRLSVGR